jgi:hypothetical protein
VVIAQKLVRANVDIIGAAKASLLLLVGARANAGAHFSLDAYNELTTKLMLNSSYCRPQCPPNSASAWDDRLFLFDCLVCKAILLIDTSTFFVLW